MAGRKFDCYETSIGLFEIQILRRTMRLSRQAVTEILDHNVISSPLCLFIEKRNYKVASHAEIEAALSDFDPGEWQKDYNDCADMACRCLAHLLSRLPARAVFKCKIPNHYLCGFLDIEGRIQMIEPALANSMHEWIFQWPGPYQPNERIYMTMLDMP